MKTAVVGGGAAGFFLAVNLKEMMPEMEVVIFERSSRVLAKVEVSGGGRCNCTNSFEDVTDLSSVYPRGHRLMKRLMNVFDHRDAYEWFERHGVPLITQEDRCVFPKAQDSHAVIDCFLSLSRRYGVKICTGTPVSDIAQLADFDFVAVTTGGSPRAEGLGWLAALGHEIESPVPSLFTFNIEDAALRGLMGTVVEAEVKLAGTKFSAAGPLLMTHWGMSGPAILKLSSCGARFLAESGYRASLVVNWLQRSENEVRAILNDMARREPGRLVASHAVGALTQRLWTYLTERALGADVRRWGDLNRKEMNRLVTTLTGDVYSISGRGKYKDEFVTAGGIALQSVNPSTLESRHRPGLYFAGEVLDVDGVTGGFNFQAAWTTAYTVARSIAGVGFEVLGRNLH